LWFARGITIAIVLVSLGLFAFALPFRFAELVRTTLRIVTMTGPLTPIPSPFSPDLWLKYYLVFSHPFNLKFSHFVLLMAWWTSGLYAQIYRYRRVSNPIERQQTKWIVFGVALAVVVYGLYGPLQYWLVTTNPSGTAAAVFQLVGVPLFLLCDLIIPLAFTFSILRYRLWDIDVIIRRTLVYGGLTATLLLIYIASVVLLQSLVTAVGGQQSAVVTVISTLLIAALFNPLRRRIQSDIDRRFYRSHYDSEKIVAAFSAGLRDQVDLDQLRDRLLVVLEDTLQPESVSLWLRNSSLPVKNPSTSISAREEPKR
jgi:hypothetical protein